MSSKLNDLHGCGQLEIVQNHLIDIPQSIHVVFLRDLTVTETGIDEMRLLHVII